MKRLLVFTFVLISILTVVGCSRENMENTNTLTNSLTLGNLNDYTPIALVDNEIIYNYIQDDVLVLGTFDIDTKTETDMISVSNFYISTGITAVVGETVYLPVTLNTNEHQIVKMDLSTNSTEVLFTEKNSYPNDIISTTDEKIYMFSTISNDDGTQTYLIRYYNYLSNKMDICVSKKSSDGERIEAFACNNGNLYVIVSKFNNVNIEIYDYYGNLVKTIYFDDELIDNILSNGIVQFYCLGDYVYLRNYSDYGAIGKIEDSHVKSLLLSKQLRIAYKNKNTNDLYYAFFIRESNEVYILDTQNDVLNKTVLDLSKDESIRNAISDGNKIVISVLDESNDTNFDTKETIIVNIVDFLN